MKMVSDRKRSRDVDYPMIPETLEVVKVTIVETRVQKQSKNVSVPSSWENYRTVEVRTRKVRVGPKGKR